MVRASTYAASDKRVVKNNYKSKSMTLRAGIAEYTELKKIKTITAILREGG